MKQKQPGERPQCWRQLAKALSRPNGGSVYYGGCKRTGGMRPNFGERVGRIHFRLTPRWLLEVLFEFYRRTSVQPEYATPSPRKTLPHCSGNRRSRYEFSVMMEAGGGFGIVFAPDYSRLRSKSIKHCRPRVVMITNA